jgi:hypothetical protein
VLWRIPEIIVETLWALMKDQHVVSLSDLAPLILPDISRWTSVGTGTVSADEAGDIANKTC